MILIKTIIYKTSNGKEPFNDWFFDLDKSIRTIVISRLKRVSLGNFGDCKLIKGTSGISELRIDEGPGYRIYFGRQNTTIMVLLIGGEKKTQKRDIVKAQKY